MIRAALRRIVLLVAGSLLVVTVGSLLLGLAFGASPARAVSLGLTLVGSFLLISGFFVGNRGPARVKGAETDLGGGPFIFGRRLLRWATPSEREETIALSAVFIAVGFVLILAGLAADPRYRLF